MADQGGRQLMNRHDEARRNRSIRRLLSAREALQLEALCLGGRAEVLEEYGTVLAALAGVDTMLDRLTVAKIPEGGVIDAE